MVVEFDMSGMLLNHEGAQRGTATVFRSGAYADLQIPITTHAITRLR